MEEKFQYFLVPRCWYFLGRFRKPLKSRKLLEPLNWLSLFSIVGSMVLRGKDHQFTKASKHLRKVQRFVRNWMGLTRKFYMKVGTYPSERMVVRCDFKYSVHTQWEHHAESSSFFLCFGKINQSRRIHAEILRIPNSANSVKLFGSYGCDCTWFPSEYMTRTIHVERLSSCVLRVNEGKNYAYRRTLLEEKPVY